MASRQGRLLWTPVVCLLILSLPAKGWGWGGQAHRWVNRTAFVHLPSEMVGFERWAGVISSQASAADARKAVDPLEAPRHWIDIDNYPEFARGELSHDLDSLRAQHGHHLDVYGNGVIPWTIAGVTETLTVAIAAGNWSQAVLLAADLGHYVADCHQPLHTTANYDGQLSGNDGVHLRYEIHMLRGHLAQLSPDSVLAAYVEDPLEHIFATIPGTWIYVNSIMAADRQARKRSPDYDQEYYRAMWQRTGGFTARLLNQAARILADLWYTAWVDAGRPEFPPPSAAETIASIDVEPDVLSLVTIRGVVTIGAGVLDEEHTRIYVQDESGRGIMVFDHHPRADIARGDVVVVEGIVQNYRGTAEILGPSVAVLEREHPLPSPRVLSTKEANDSRWNNTLIQVRGTVVFTLEDESWTRFHLDDGSGAVVVLVLRETDIELAAVKEGDELAVCGVGAFLSEEGTHVILPGYTDHIVWKAVGDGHD